MKKKGFTLIELLAVIVILAVIALIAVPIVLNIINSSKKNSYVRSAELYTQQLLDSTYNAESCTVNSDGTALCDGRTIEVVESNTSPKSGTIKLVNGQIQNGSTLTFDNTTLEYKEGKWITSSTTPTLSNDMEEPDLSIGLTPVKYNGTNWEVADTKSEWYNYDKQQWANAVLLKDGVTKSVGDIVNIESNTTDIIGIFVWIPRFEYKVEGEYGKGGTSKTSPGEIEINFLSQYTTSSKSGYRLHPGFTFGNMPLSGLWLGKFETTGDSSNPTVLANTASLRNQNVSSEFTTSQSLTSKLTNGDSHMTKGSEWMTASYLSQSKYGKYGNILYTGSNKEVYQNKSSSYITGSSNGTPSQDTTNTQCKYNDLTDRGSGKGSCGGGAFTTGNIYGIYDMSGGAWEYQMSNYNKTSGKSAVLNSGFNGTYSDGTTKIDGKDFPDSKYYELYTTEDKTTACNGECYGLTEIRGWYGDSDYFVHASYPWLYLGGYWSYGTIAGVFDVSHSSGDVIGIDTSFRIALTSQ